MASAVGLHRRLPRVEVSAVGRRRKPCGKVVERLWHSRSIMHRNLESSGLFLLPWRPFRYEHSRQHAQVQRRETSSRPALFEAAVGGRNELRARPALPRGSGDHVGRRTVRLRSVSWSGGIRLTAICASRGRAAKRMSHDGASSKGGACRATVLPATGGDADARRGHAVVRLLRERGSAMTGPARRFQRLSPAWNRIAVRRSGLPRRFGDGVPVSRMRRPPPAAARTPRGGWHATRSRDPSRARIRSVRTAHRPGVRRPAGEDPDRQPVRAVGLGVRKARAFPPRIPEGSAGFSGATPAAFRSGRRQASWAPRPRTWRLPLFGAACQRPRSGAIPAPQCEKGSTLGSAPFQHVGIRTPRPSNGTLVW
jgi:hypothetical protein